MRIESKPLRFFFEVASTGSFTLAAQNLNVAQPAVSMTIRKLEDNLNLKLFHREDRKVSLTDEGQALARHAERVLLALEDTELAMQEYRSLENGEVRVGIPNMMGSYFFPPVLMAFRLRHPNLKLSVTEGGTAQLQHMLLSSQLDLAVVMSESVTKELEGQHILTEQMMVTVAKDHEFARYKEVTPKQFFAEELVMFKGEFFLRKAIDRLAKEVGCQPEIAIETNLIPLIKSVIQHGFGISALLPMAIAPEDDLATIPFSTPLWMEFCIAWRKNGYLSRANRAFLEFVLEHSANTSRKESLNGA